MLFSIYSEIQHRYTFIQAAISAHMELGFFMHTHIDTCVGIVNRPSRLFLFNKEKGHSASYKSYKTSIFTLRGGGAGEVAVN